MISKNRTRTLLFLAVMLNLLILVFFRYLTFLSENVSFLTFLEPNIVQLNILVPLGISFFTFEFLHYLFDVYKGQKPITNIIHFILFPFFFPSQIAGPIKRFEDFLPQLTQKRAVDWGRIQHGVFLIIRGFFKKLVMADNLVLLVIPAFEQHSSPWVTLIGIYAFAFQIYFDFSGYTDIGRGSAYLLGISLPENFNMPYVASSVREFWKRWHMSLMRWFTDYVYVPLGGSKVGKIHLYINIFIVFLISGLWHGAAWNYIWWGAYNAAWIVLEHSVNLREHERKFTRLRKAVHIVITFHIIVVGWVLFRADSVLAAKEIIARALPLQLSSITLNQDMTFVGMLLLIYVLYFVVQKYVISRTKLQYAVRYLAYGAAIVLIMFHLNLTQNHFIYFQF